MRIEHNGEAIVKGTRFETVKNFRLVVTPLIQRVMPLRARSPKFIDRGMVTEKASFTVALEHKTVADAERYCWNHRAGFSPVGPFKVTCSEGQIKNIFWAEGALYSSSATYMGRTTFIDYECESGEILTNKPT